MGPDIPQQSTAASPQRSNSTRHYGASPRSGNASNCAISRAITSAIPLIQAKGANSMKNWIKRISTIGFTLVVIEGVAWVGLSILGTDALAAIWPTQQHPSATDAIVTATSSGVEKCSTFNGDLFCIEEAAGNAVGTPSERCATHDGALYCIAGDA
jgi:hypothetical protein